MSDFHHVLAVYDSHTDEQVRFAIVKGDENEDQGALVERCIIEDEQYAKVVGSAPTNIEAKRLHRKLMSEMEKWSPTLAKKDPQKLPSIEPRLPDSPKMRAIMFRSYPKEDQEDFVYQLITRTGAPKGRLTKWLGLKDSELDHIDQSVIDAAVAELELRISGNLIGFASANKAATAISPTMFLSKAMLGWTEAGPNAKAEGGQNVDINIKVVDNKNPELEALRTQLDDLVDVANRKASMRLVQ